MKELFSVTSRFLLKALSDSDSLWSGEKVAYVFALRRSLVGFD